MNSQSTIRDPARRNGVPRDEAEDARRVQLIEVTIDSLAAVGFVGTTLAEIAGRAGVSPGLVAHYFGDKDGLLEAAFRALARVVAVRMRERFALARTPRARVQAIIDANLGPENFDRRIGNAWLAFWGQVLHFEGLKRVQRAYQVRMLSNLRSDLRRMIPAEAAHSLAAMIAAMIDGVWLRAARLLRERNDELAELETRNTGKPIQETRAVDVISGAECIEYFAGLAAGLAGEHLDLGPKAFGYTRREPLGVVAGIGAWNYPLQIACWKSAPALACGNAMIFKPAELTPLTALKLSEIYREAGVPEGVFQVVQGYAPTGQLLTRHPCIRKISLTGEVSTGKAVMADAASTLKQVTLELGGKSPLIVFEDAQLDNAVSGALLGNFYSAGEVCSNGTRVFVHRSVRAEFVERLRARTAAMRVGDPLDPDTQVGALISAEHMQKVLTLIARGRAQGARLVTGGARLTSGALGRGCFVAPTVFDACHDEMDIVRQEIFGPVMSVLEFDTEEEAVARANATEFGLAAGVFTNDLTRAHRVIAQLEAGTCWINHYNITPVELPFGGVKMSGLGRENGRAALEHYTQLKSVYVAMADIEAPY